MNAHPSSPKEDHVLRLLFFEDCRAVVSNVCDLNGYLFLSMGQKLYGRAFEQDEFLLSVGFLDVGVHVTSLQAMKNFLLIGDAVQSLALVAFQVRFLPFHPSFAEVETDDIVERRRTRTSLFSSVVTTDPSRLRAVTSLSTMAKSPSSLAMTKASSVSSSTIHRVRSPSSFVSS